MKKVQGSDSDVDRGEAANRFSLRIERLEHRQQLRNGQEVPDAAGEAQQLQRAALAADGGERADDFSEPRAVEVIHASQIQEKSLVALMKEAVDFVAQELGALAKRDTALDVDHRDVADDALCDGHIPPAPANFRC